MDYLERARTVIDLEVGEVLRLRDRIDGRFGEAVVLLERARGAGRRVMVCGAGERGNIAAKLAAALTSSGRGSGRHDGGDIDGSDGGGAESAGCVARGSGAGE